MEELLSTCCAGIIMFLLVVWLGVEILRNAIKVFFK